MQQPPMCLSYTQESPEIVLECFANNMWQLRQAVSEQHQTGLVLRDSSFVQMTQRMQERLRSPYNITRFAFRVGTGEEWLLDYSRAQPKDVAPRWEMGVQLSTHQQPIPWSPNPQQEGPWATIASNYLLPSIRIDDLSSFVHWCTEVYRGELVPSGDDLTRKLWQPRPFPTLPQQFP